MQNPKRSSRARAARRQLAEPPAPEGVEPVESAEEGEFDAYDTFEIYRVVCPDCAQPIALLADEDVLPEHALCASPWDPFGLTVCAGTGRAAASALPADEGGPEEQEIGVLLTLPQGLDWRTQPFSHVGGPGSRPIKAPRRPLRTYHRAA
ncbi:hypothetical protein [Streptomyces sp. SID11385]|uniref:hypothetical protein n=1 Tax=Streptomyces sp. SID11385 TaxID=2706031 RepID=UPI0013C8E50C|nr:hypothetical protein [Streptomyces sp. SID11385]NEA43754.1 hypothetical protein [Streptomyces sp. SID11385]